MRSDGIWHSELVRVLADLRHHDTLVIADAGLPVPGTVPTIEIGWRRGEPRTTAVLAAVLDELVVERATLAREVRDPDLAEVFGRVLDDVPVDSISHEDLKRAVGSARAVVRTGDDIPYANVILHAGVPFGATP
jgi:D-ribose pyranase